MTIADKKKELLKWEDLFGGKLDPTEIRKAKRNTDLSQLLWNHTWKLEEQVKDAQSSIKRFRDKIGL